MTNISYLSTSTAVLGALALNIVFANHAQAQGYPVQPNQGYTVQRQVAPVYVQPRAVNPNIQTRYYNAQQPQLINSRYGAQTSAVNPKMVAPNATSANAYKQSFWDKLTGKQKQMYDSRNSQLRGARIPQYQVRPNMPGPLDQFQRWSTAEPEYTLYPGDQIDIVVNSAPELSRTLTVGPDGRVVMPMTQPVMAAGRTMQAVEADLSAHLATQLVDPRIDVTPRAYGPQQIFVGGEVAAQGTYTLPGPIGAMEAILMAGGFQTGARTKQVVILRRAANGGFMARTIDFQDGLQNTRSFTDNVQMKRGDIIFVPRSDIAEVSQFVRNVRSVLPFDISLSYNLGDSFTNN